ncbi:MAG: choice-of-anchor X domain-containing protein [Thermoanaerobaculia bacterium]
MVHDIKNRGARVFTIGLGDPADPVYPLDAVSLQKIADDTGGLYRHAENEAGLPAIYAEYSAEVRGDAVSSEATETLPEQGPAEVPAYIDSFTKEATFVLHWPVGPGFFDLKLRRPDGGIIDAGTPASDPKVTYLEHPFYKFYRVSEPTVGTWTLIVRASQTPPVEVGENRGESVKAIAASVARPQFTTQVLASAPGVDFVSDLQGFVFRYPHSPVLRASVYANVPVAGAEVTAIVTAPQALAKNVKLYDDGQVSHGDMQANDGVYSNRFLDFPVNGGYEVRLLVENKKGVEAVPDEVTPPGWVPKPIAPFTRVTKAQFMIEGVPDDLVRPEITQVTPGRGRYGSVVEVTIRGAHFVDGANVLFSNPVLAVETIRRVSDEELAVRLRVGKPVADPFSDITVVNPGGLDVVATRAFQAVGVLYPFGLSLHAGVAQPSGSFGHSHDPGLSLVGDLEYRFGNAYVLELLAGYHEFAGVNTTDTSWRSLVLGLKRYLPVPKWLFVEAGLGAYFPESGSTELGWMIGGGAHWALTASLSFEVSYIEHTIKTSGTDTTFSTLWGGVRHRF